MSSSLKMLSKALGEKVKKSETVKKDSQTEKNKSSDKTESSTPKKIYTAATKKAIRIPMKRHIQAAIRKKEQTTLSRPAFKRLMYRAGVKRSGGLVYGLGQSEMDSFLRKVLSCASLHTVHCKRKTITLGDVKTTMQLYGRPLYGFQK